MSISHLHKYENFANSLRKAVPGAVISINKERLPFLEKALNRSLAEQYASSSQPTQDFTKQANSIMWNAIVDEINSKSRLIEKSEIEGSDFKLISDNSSWELKITSSQGDGWTGNYSKKTPLHLLIKVKLDKTWRISHIFVAIVNLEDCASAWSGSRSSNYNALKFSNADRSKIKVIVGQLREKDKYLMPELESVDT